LVQFRGTDIPLFATAANDKKSRAKENENLFTVLANLSLPRVLGRPWYAGTVDSWRSEDK
jgi:hypothetical protein